jgi:hypothetical protein
MLRADAPSILGLLDASRLPVLAPKASDLPHYSLGACSIRLFISLS